MHVYNTIIVLKEILPVFPVASVNEASGPALEMAMEKFLEKEDRDDLKILGRAYVASLQKREPAWRMLERSVRVCIALAFSRPPLIFLLARCSDVCEADAYCYSCAT